MASFWLRFGFVLGFASREKRTSGRPRGPPEADRVVCLFLCLQSHTGNWLCSCLFAGEHRSAAGGPVDGIEKWLRFQFGYWLAPGWWRLGVLRLGQGWTSFASRVADGVGRIQHEGV